MDDSGWTHLEYIEWFNMYVESEWEEFIEYGEENGFKYKELSILRQMARFSMRRDNPSFKQLSWAKRIVDRIEAATSDE